MMKNQIGIIVIVLLLNAQTFAQIPVADVRIACSSEYFRENDEQHALIVGGTWCQDLYYWSIIGIGDTIDELAYYQGSLFTGECVDYNIHNQLIGRYTFDNGYIIRLQEYDTTGLISLDFNFSMGIPNGSNTIYNEKGEVQTLLTFDHGTLNGPYLKTYNFYDLGLGECKEQGSYINGEEKLETPPCTVD